MAHLSRPTVLGNLSRLPLTRRIALRRREMIAGYLFIAPAVLGFVVFTAGPIIASVVISLTNYDIISPPHWTGFDNYAALFQDSLFWQSMLVTVKAAVIGLPLGLALSLAILLNQRIKAIAFWRTVYFLPSVLSGVAVAVLWLWLLNPEFGVLDLVLRHIGLPAPDWLGDTATALPSLVVVSLWGIGGSIVIYLAGLQGIPTELYEAAEVDGANAWQRFLHVTLPMLSPVIFFNLIIGLIGQFQWFTEPFVMTQGGPENSTLTFMLYLYQNAFTYFKMGYASAMAWVFFALVLVLTVLVFRSSPMWVHYEGERRR
jgi:multiple sugar transport system permease protein